MLALISWQHGILSFHLHISFLMSNFLNYIFGNELHSPNRGYQPMFWFLWSLFLYLTPFCLRVCRLHKINVSFSPIELFEELCKSLNDNALSNSLLNENKQWYSILESPTKQKKPYPSCLNMLLTSWWLISLCSTLFVATTVFLHVVLLIFINSAFLWSIPPMLTPSCYSCSFAHCADILHHKPAQVHLLFLQKCSL